MRAVRGSAGCGDEVARIRRAISEFSERPRRWAVGTRTDDEIACSIRARAPPLRPQRRRGERQGGTKNRKMGCGTSAPSSPKVAVKDIYGWSLDDEPLQRRDSETRPDLRKSLATGIIRNMESKRDTHAPLQESTKKLLKGIVKQNFDVDLSDAQVQAVADLMKESDQVSSTKSAEMKQIVDIVLAGDDTGGVSVIRDCRVFIGYRVASDANLVERLYDKLKAAGVDVWWDKKCLPPGQPWEEGFADGLCSSNIFVPILSKAALAPCAQLTTSSACDTWCEFSKVIYGDRSI